MWSRTGPIGLGWSLKEVSSAAAMKSFSDRYLKNKKSLFGDNFTGVKNLVESDLFNFFNDSYFKYYINNLYDESYYKTLSTNYIVFLQKYFKWKNQKYIMCDAFDKMVFDTNLVDTNFYYRDKTALDILDDDGGDVYEKPIHNKELRRAQHPNINGHKLISKKLFEFIMKEKIK